MTDWHVVPDRSFGKAGVQIYRDGKFIKRFSMAELGVPENEMDLLCRWLPEKLAAEGEALLAEPTYEERRQAFIDAGIRNYEALQEFMKTQPPITKEQAEAELRRQAHRIAELTKLSCSTCGQPEVSHADDQAADPFEAEIVPAATAGGELAAGDEPAEGDEPEGDEPPEESVEAAGDEPESEYDPEEEEVDDPTVDMSTEELQTLYAKLRNQEDLNDEERLLWEDVQTELAGRGFIASQGEQPFGGSPLQQGEPVAAPSPFAGEE